MALDNIKKFFGVVETEETSVTGTGAEDMYYKVSKGEVQEESQSSNKMILFEPRAYSESSQIVDYLKSRNTVVVNLKRVTPDQAKRIIDFLTGSLYAMNGNLQKLGGGIFLCAPNNINIEGKITEEGKATPANKGKAKEEKEDEFNW